MSTSPIVYRETENLQDGTNISKKNKPDNQNSKKVLNDLKIDENILVPNYVHKLSRGEFIPWNKVLNDPVYAEKWMREVIEPMVGRPVRAGDNILPNQTHIIYNLIYSCSSFHIYLFEKQISFYLKED